MIYESELSCEQNVGTPPTGVGPACGRLGVQPLALQSMTKGQL